MKNLSDLKRFLTVGVTVRMTACDGPGKRWIGKKRHVVKKQTNGVFFKDPDDSSSKPSFLDFPRASLLEIDGKKFRIYYSGSRPLTQAEKTIKDGYEKTRNKKQEEIDIMSDSSTSYWQKVGYYLKHNATYLMGNETQKGMRFEYKTGLIRDDSIKGNLALEYEMLDN